MNREPVTQTLDLPTAEALSELEQHVQRRLNGRVRDFRLSLRDDGLVLKGYARSYYAKQLAQHAVMEAVDVPINANDIEVI
jgi:hypothetical protein